MLQNICNLFVTVVPLAVIVTRIYEQWPHRDGGVSKIQNSYSSLSVNWLGGGSAGIQNGVKLIICPKVMRC